MSEAKAPVVYVVYYSTYGHIASLAESVAEGAKEAGATVKILRIPETLPAEVLEKMHAPAKNEEHEEITDVSILAEADAIIFGIPTRFGSMAAQVKAFFDRMGGLWQSGGLVGKLASVFFSTGSQNGGQETTALTTYTNFVHLGMIIVPIGYSSPLLFQDEVHGGSPYGAGTLAGPTGQRQASDLEKKVAHHQGGLVTKYAGQFKKGAE